MRLIPLPCALAGLLVASVATAQEPPPPPGDGARSHFAHDRRARDLDMAARRARHEQEREADMALVLDLNPDQRARLHAFLAGMTPPPPAEREREVTKPQNSERTFGARLAAQQADLDAFTSAERARLATARAFFDGLSPAQREKFEALRRLGHPHHPMMEQDGPEGPPPGMSDREPPRPGE